MAAVHFHIGPEREKRRREMVAMRLEGKPYSIIARKFKVRSNTVRTIVVKAIGMEKANAKRSNP